MLHRGLLKGLQERGGALLGVLQAAGLRHLLHHSVHPLCRALGSWHAGSSGATTAGSFFPTQGCRLIWRSWLALRRALLLQLLLLHGLCAAGLRGLAGLLDLAGAQAQLIQVLDCRINVVAILRQDFCYDLQKGAAWGPPAVSSGPA